MEPSVNTETHALGSMTEKGIVDSAVSLSNVSPETDSGIVSVQLLEFKTSLLEAVEELRIHRDADTSYEAQICKLALEKQELEWQKSSLQSQINRMTTEHADSLNAVKKQSQIRAVEGEKGKHQLTAELKNKEIISLKEELKLLQLFKYSLEKKLSELDQKLQVQTQVKDSHLNQLAEVEKRFRTVTKQFATVKQTHEKLEQNVEEAMQLNKKLVTTNKKQESTIAALKKDVERLNGELVKYKVLSIYSPGEENLKFLMKDQELQELKQKLIVEKEENKKLRDENAVESTQKQDLLSSLQHVQWLLHNQTEAVCRTEEQLRTHTEDYQLLKREHEMIQERSKEREQRLTQLIEEHKNTKSTLEKEVETLQTKLQINEEQLKAVKEAYDHLHENHRQLSACQMLRNGSKDISNIQRNSDNPNCDIPVDISAANLIKDEPLDTEASQVHPANNCEQMSLRKEVEDIPDERTAGCQEAAEDGCSGGEKCEVNICTQADQTALALPPSSDLQALAPDQSKMSENIGPNAVFKNLTADSAVKQETSERDTVDNSRPLSGAQIYKDSSFTELSQLKTRSVYGVAGDPLMSETKDRPEEQSLGVSDTKEHQTSDKHTPKTSRDGDLKGVDPQNAEPEAIRPQSDLPNNSTELDPQDSILHSALPDEQNQILLKNEQFDSLHSCQKHLQETDLRSPASISEENKDQLSQFEMDCSLRSESPKQQQVLNEMRGGCVGKTEGKSELVEISNLPRSLSPSTKVFPVNLEEATETEGHCVAVVSTQTLDDGQNAKMLSGLSISDHLEDLSDAPQLPILGGGLIDTEMHITEISNLNNTERIGSSSAISMDTELKQSSSLEDVPSLDKRFTSSEPSRPSISELKPVPPSGFQELLASLQAPLISQHKPQNRVITRPLEKANVSNIHPHQKSDRHGEWNAIKRTFSEKEDRVPISFGSAQPGSPAARAVGNGLRQDCTLTPPPWLHGLGKVSQPVCEGSAPTPLQKQDHQWSDIRAQISKIERFLSSEGFRPQKRCKLDNSEVLKF